MNVALKIGGLVRLGQPADFFASDRARKALRWAGLSSVFGLCLAPFVAWQHPQLMTTWQAEWLAGWFGLGVAAPLLASNAWRQVRLPVLAAPFLVLLLVVLGQAAVGHEATPGVAVGYGAELIWALVLMFGASAMDARRVKSAAITGMTLAAVANAALACVQAARLGVFKGHPALYAPDGLAYGFLAQRNEFADFQFLAVVGLLSLAEWRCEYWRREYLRALLIVLFAGSAALSGSNTIVLYVAWLLVWSLWRQDAQQSLMRRLSVRYGLLAGLSALAVFEARARLSGVRHVAGAHILTQLWGQALHAIKAHPWWGVGFGNAPSVYYHYAGSVPDTARYLPFHAESWNHAHDIFLHLWMEGGVFAELALLGFVVAVGWAMLRVRETARQTHSVWAVGILGILAAHSLVEFPLWTLPFLGVCAIASALVIKPVEVRCAAQVGVAPVAIVGILGMGALLLVQLNVEMRDLMGIWNYPFVQTNVYANVETQMVLEHEERSRTLAARILMPLAYLDQERFPVVMFVPDQWARRYAENQVLMRIMPSGFVPYVNAQLYALQGHSSASVMRKTLDVCHASPGFADRFRDVVTPLAARGFKQLAPMVDALNICLSKSNDGVVNEASKP